MAYTEPTASLFKARYPEFSSVPDALIGLVLAEAISEVGTAWLERDRARAQMVLVAHKLTLEGEPSRSSTGVGMAGSGPVKRDRVGDVETEFAGAGAGVIASAKTFGFSDTKYGLEFLRLQKLNFPAIAAV